MAFSNRLHRYLCSSSDEDDGDDDAGDAAAATTVAPPEPAPVVALPSGSSEAAMSAPRSNPAQLPPTAPRPASQPSVVDRPFHSTYRQWPTAARPPVLNPPAIHSPAQLPPTAPRPDPRPSVVDRPLCSTYRPSPTAARPPVDAATTRHRSEPYHLVRGTERVAPDQSPLDSIVCYTEDWRPYRVNLLKDRRWWEWDHGIIDLRALHRTKSTAIAGVQLTVAFEACQSVLRRHACEFKVGMARTLGGRWELYQSSSDTWTPTHLFIVLHVRGRHAVGFAEAGLIGMLYECGKYDEQLNVNNRNNDRGGSGPRHEHELDDWFYVYLATRSVS